MSSAAPPAPTHVRVAHVRRAHGVQGEIAVTPLGGDIGRFAVGTHLMREDTGAGLTVRSARPGVGSEALLLRFDEIGDRETAADLTGGYLCVDPSAVRALAGEEWFVWQLIGLRALDVSGHELGRVVDVAQQPAQDILVVDGDGGRQLYPMVEAFVRSIDIDKAEIVITPWQWVSE